LDDHPHDARGDPFDLQRFVDAQRDVFARVEAELREGHKSSHWMWFVFPQIAGLGRSPMARRYAISSATEARAYLAHPLLGPRLRHCTRLVLETEGRSIEEILGRPDDMKFRSSMTLFAEVTPDKRLLLDALAKYFGGVPDRATLERLAGPPPAGPG
jgi:uncharacterized protein (DUF1810 family)